MNIPFLTLTSDRDEQNDLINGQLETILGILQGWNVRCATEVDSSVLDACESLEDAVLTLAQALRDYVSIANSVMITIVIMFSSNTVRDGELWLSGT